VTTTLQSVGKERCITSPLLTTEETNTRRARDTERMPSPKRKRVLIGSSVLLLLVVAAVIGWRGVGRWLIREDPLSPAEVVVVLSGGMPYRAEEAAKLFLMGDARQIWVSRAVSPASELEKLGIHFVADEEYDREVLLHEGVPEQSVQILPDAIVNTEQEVQEIAREMQRQGISKVIIVTSPQHTRRVRTLWAKLAPDDRKAVVRAAYEDPFDADHWWRNTRDTLSVTHEMLGLMNAWAGLPVRPHGT